MKAVLIVLAAIFVSACNNGTSERLSIADEVLDFYEMSGPEHSSQPLKAALVAFARDYQMSFDEVRFGPNESGVAYDLTKDDLIIVFELLNGDAVWGVGFFLQLDGVLADHSAYEAERDDLLQRLRSIEGVQIEAAVCVGC